MQGDTVNFEGYGTFKASASSRSPHTLPHFAFGKGVKILDTDTNSNNHDKSGLYPKTGWLSTGSSYTGTNGYATTTASTRFGYSGEWLELELPFKIKLRSFILRGAGHSAFEGAGVIDQGINRLPRHFVIWGYDGTVWEELQEFTTSLQFANSTTLHQPNAPEFEFSLPTAKYYNNFAVVIKRTWSPMGSDGVSASSVTAIGELRFFGTREQLPPKQSVLHDGNLTLTKNLDVPRIGPPLDADDTPRRDRLMVEYNTSTNPVEDGVVRDTSGRGFDGAFYGGAYYDASAKALEFDAVSGTALESGILPLQGDASHSFSFWFNRQINGNDVLVSLATPGDDPPTISTMSNFYVTTNGGGSWFSISNDVTFPANTFTDGSWFHVVCIYKGGGATVGNKEIYVNGDKITLTLSGHSTAGDPLNFTNPTLSLGAEHAARENYYFGGSISQFKLYDTPLTAQEVKTLYDMGRAGSVANPQPLHIAAPLYSPGTIVQAQYASTPLNNTVRQTITGGELSDAANDVDYLDMNFKPKFANSSILLTAMINNNATHVASFGFKEDGTVVRTQANNDNATGGISTIYNDSNSESQMFNTNIQVMVPANGTHTRRYNVAANSYWSDTNYNLHINDRGGTADMRSISNMVVYEIVN